MSIYITAIEIERFKRLKLVTLTPTAEGLTVIGGRNGQGKTSILDAIVYALGGEKHRPSEPRKRGSDKSPTIKLTLSNGLVVERKGKNTSLKVTDPKGLKGGQGVLDKFVEELALNLPRFMSSSPTQKAETLLRLIGAGDELHNLDLLEEEVFMERRAAGRELERTRAVLDELEKFEDAPADIVSVSELVDQIKLSEEMRRDRDSLDRREDNLLGDISEARNQIQLLEAVITKSEEEVSEIKKLQKKIKVPDVEEIRTRLAGAEEMNEKVRANKGHDQQARTVASVSRRHKKLEKKLLDVRLDRRKLLLDADMPLEGLSILDGELVYEDAKWDCMSAADQLKVAASIVKRLNSDCGFVLIDKLEQMDVETMMEFGKWAESEGLQIIATRVSTGEECSIVIEDGEAK